MPIKFGSDGWRGVIGHEFTFENVARIALAVAEQWKGVDFTTQGHQIPLGFDTRFLSRRMARFVELLLEQNDALTVCLPFPVPSPFMTFACSLSEHRDAIGIQVTASHNPYFYNGVKLKTRRGSLDPEKLKEIEEQANTLSLPRLPEAGGDGPIADYEEALGHMGRWYETAILKAAGDLNEQPVAVDYMNGAGISLYGWVLQRQMNIVSELRNSVDPLFGGGKPEPLEHLLPELIQRVKAANDGTVGLAFDGDGDRLAVIDETGAYLQSHEIFALLLDYLAGKTENGERVYPGSKVVTTVSFSSLLGRIAESYGLEVLEVPVGFKHVSEAMLAGDVLIGGEESGGAAFGHYLPERDALLMALTLLRAKGEAGVTLHEMLRNIYARFGRSEFVHVDVQLDPTSAQELRARIASLLEVGSVAGEAVTARSDKDGVKLRTGAGWVLVRASGTEPLARFYAEAESQAIARRMIEDVRSKIL